MTEQAGKQGVSSIKSNSLKLFDIVEWQEYATQLFDQFLTHLAADIENSLHELEHKVLVHLASTKAMFIVGIQRSGDKANSAINACAALENSMLKFKC